MSLHKMNKNGVTTGFCKGADRLYLPLLFVVSLTVLLIVYHQINTYIPFEEMTFLSRWLKQDFLALGLFGIAVGLLLWQVVFALRYKPFARVSTEQLPTLTVVIPAYNEGSQILDTVRSVMASDYPKDLLQVICIDDGSKDDTWKWMNVAHDEFAGCVTLIKQPMNMGKREALMAGFAKATGDVIVTLDSDSEVLPNTLAEVVSPFVHDQRVGSVAGNVRVLNMDEGMIPKMLEVSFTSAFDFIRAGQSVYGGVFCTPGALSAYRSTVLQPLLAEWSTQTFMGKPATIGEDRALTNLVLATGHRVVYQREAVVLTKVPTNYGSLKRMLTRWARSNVRESLVMFTFVFTNFRKGEGANWVRLFSVTQIIRMTMFEALKIALVAALIMHTHSTLTLIAMGCLTGAFIPSVVYLLRYRSLFGFCWSVPFNFFWMFTLSWIPLWGMFTANNSGWLTRTLPASSTAVQPPSMNGVPAGQSVS